MRYSRLLILICLLACIVSWAAFIIPSYLEYQEIGRKLIVQKSFLDNQTLYYQKLKEIYDRLSQSPDAVLKVDTMIPNEMDYAALVNFLNIAGQETGVLIQSVSVGTQGKMAGQDRIKENNLFVTIMGTYASFKNFLYKIENSSRLFEIDEINFSSVKAGTDFFNYNLKVRTYSY
ncbi:MAG: type 4a pilus biogenesis protein PilO [Candidatus Pacebacteria bacterium]|nr:type 4a pilus biogenesis protein PilO [Candidatus Paceibacterota bacterium]MDD5621238.1 type 4a pilus biogenesis protein PilO [Candidatus Paceibacterota bacterium]